MLNIWKNSEFVRSVTTLMTGTVLAQVISYLVYPLITRIYSTEEMGELGLYMRWIPFIAAIATARYELAIPLPKEESTARLLYRLSHKIAKVVILASFVFFALYYTLVGWKDANVYFGILVVLSAYITVWIQTGTSWAVRKKEFKSISYQRITNSFGVNGFRYLFGVLGWGAFGLLFGTFLGMGLSIIRFVSDFLKFNNKKEINSEHVSLRPIAKEYKVYPKINLPHTLLDLGVDLSIAALIVFYFDKSSFGSFSHAYLMLKLPISIMGQSVGQVFYQRCSEKINRGESIYPEFLKTAKVLFLIGIVPFTVLFFLGDWIFPLVFGDEWVESGQFAEWMAPFLFLNFVLSPLSTIVLVLKRQTEAFWIGVFVASIQLFSFGVLPLWNFTLIEVIEFNFLALTIVLFGVYFMYKHFSEIGFRGTSSIKRYE
jgi:O-antigen/teichoic acid export membrane protein